MRVLSERCEHCGGNLLATTEMVDDAFGSTVQFEEEVRCLACSREPASVVAARLEATRVHEEARARRVAMGQRHRAPSMNGVRLD